MLKTAAFLATSLDGYIAAPGDDLQWLDEVNERLPTGEDCGYQSFMHDIDVLIMGRRTFEKVLSFETDWPYACPVYVMTSQPNVVPLGLQDKVVATALSPVELLEALEQQGFRHAYVDGGQTINRFLKAGRLDRLILTHIPILLGQGTPLFAPSEQRVSLELIECRTYPLGLVQSHYRILK